MEVKTISTNEKTKDQAEEMLVLTQLMHLNAIVHGISLGLILGAGIFLSTLWLVIKGGEVVGPNLALLGNFFPGYRVTLAGSLLGFIYGAVAGFFIGYTTAKIYNWIIQRFENRAA